MSNIQEPTPPGADPPSSPTVSPRFAWPPRPLPKPSVADRETVSQPRRQAGPVSLVEDVEDTWLDLAAAPLTRRMAQADWRPDTPTAYCGRCGASAGPYTTDDTGCHACRGRRWPWQQLIRLGEYHSPLGAMVRDIKYTAWRQLGTALGHTLGQAVAERCRLLEQHIKGRTLVVVPVPTSFRRRMARGIDHPLVIARGVARALDAPVASVLSRWHRPSQLTIPKSQRGPNLAGSIHASRLARLRWAWRTDRLARLPPDQVLLVVVDDVSTTRATLRATCRAVQSLWTAPGSRDLMIWTAVLACTEAGDEAFDRVLYGDLGTKKERS